MRCEFTEFEFFLDSHEENKIFMRFSTKEDSSEVTDFVLIYFTLIDNVFLEVVKYDFSLREKLHVHYYFSKRKVYLDEDVNFESMAKFSEHLMYNWQNYLLKFINK
ncbi:MAG: hypothetical protein PHD05_04445 [Sphaerochaetaceae bacterium]|nr:hypothetical protein [Sphaerochaetaceae bacterium]